MLQINKYDLRFHHVGFSPVDLTMPQGARILDVGFSGPPDILTLEIYAVVDFVLPLITYRFFLFENGSQIDDKIFWRLKHIRTIQLPYSTIHLFEEKNYGISTPPKG